MSHRAVHVTEQAGLARPITVGSHRLVADEHTPIGGDTGPDPSELLLAALGARPSTTLRMYADRHAWRLHDVQVRLRLEQGSEQGRHPGDLLDGDLDDDQRGRLMAVAGGCRVHRLLSAPPTITTVQVEQPVVDTDDSGT
ncbi:OsmC family protein [Streptomyces sp. NPDC004533]|uniref:OsmC family protein n=1 Tax=Streptomyces sp. NPDC004533 TaxID=3154278 RepID=UPI0033AF2BE2